MAAVVRPPRESPAQPVEFRTRAREFRVQPVEFRAQDVQFRTRAREIRVGDVEFRVPVREFVVGSSFCSRCLLAERRQRASGPFLSAVRDPLAPTRRSTRTKVDLDATSADLACTSADLACTSADLACLDGGLAGATRSIVAGQRPR
ncbi:hypothetical protein [Prauserella marina]|uniref:hypothetical protein n=1 Tax=Prauserella marina TaxID=530584 RepID=UPI00116000C5|nr:hypothetical protein [Prauserella marina]